jgi:hypothetical protein
LKPLMSRCVQVISRYIQMSVVAIVPSSFVVAPASESGSRSEEVDEQQNDEHDQEHRSEAVIHGEPPFAFAIERPARRSGYVAL